MRTQPVTLMTRDVQLAAEVRLATGLVGGVLEVSPAVVTPTPLNRGLLLAGADLDPVADVPTLALAHYGLSADWVLPAARGTLIRHLMKVVPPPVPLGLLVAVVGASGGVGTTAVATGLTEALRTVAGAREVTLIEVDPAADPSWTREELRRACARCAIVVADLPRWGAPLLGWCDAVVVVAGNRVRSVRSAVSVMTTARAAGLDPVLVLSTGAGGWRPSDLGAALGAPIGFTWTCDPRLAEADEQGDLVRHVVQGTVRKECLRLAEAVLGAARDRRTTTAASPAVVQTCSAIAEFVGSGQDVDDWIGGGGWPVGRPACLCGPGPVRRDESAA